MYNIPKFIGPFKDVIPLLINHKRALGYDYGKSIVYKLKEKARIVGMANT